MNVKLIATIEAAKKRWKVWSSEKEGARVLKSNVLRHEVLHLF